MEKLRANIDPLQKSETHRERTRGKSRNDRRGITRQKTKVMTSLLLDGETQKCACLGSLNLELVYAVHPAICGHWFVERRTPDGTGWETGMLRGVTITGGPDGGVIDLSKIRPIRDLEKGSDPNIVRLIATHRVSFREMRDKVSGDMKLRAASKHARKNAPKR